MTTVLRGLHPGPGPWVPLTGLGDSQRLPKVGPTQLDVECKAALQQALKPCYFPVILPWMGLASNEAKRDVMKLAQALEGRGAEASKSSAAQVVVNSAGRSRLDSAIPCSGDRHQADMLRNRSKSDQTSRDREESRRFFAAFSEKPSTQSVGDFLRLSQVGVGNDATMKVFTEQTRRKLERWQVRGPEEDPAAAAQVMRSIRSLANAVQNLHSYAECRRQEPGIQACTESLYEFSQLVPKGARTGALKPVWSAPDLGKAINEKLRPSVGASVVRWRVSLADSATAARHKIKDRAVTTKIPFSGGLQTWDTTYKAMGADI